MYTGCQIPYVYTHLMTLMVKLHLILVATVAGTFVGQGFEHGRWTDITWGYMLLLTNVIVYQGILYVHTVLVNPIRRGYNHFPEDAYIAFVETATNAVLNIRSRLPFDAATQLPPLEPSEKWRDNIPPDRDGKLADMKKNE
jgi:hypothetical protein